MTNLYFLYLSNNLLSGLIPQSICNLDWNYSMINNNQLCPPYPECIENFVGYQDTSECEECQDSIEGDTNYDGYINILDIIIVVNCILVNDCNECFDINSDSGVDILDIISMINIILVP